LKWPNFNQPLLTSDYRLMTINMQNKPNFKRLMCPNHRKSTESSQILLPICLQKPSTFLQKCTKKRALFFTFLHFLQLFNFCTKTHLTPYITKTYRTFLPQNTLHPSTHLLIHSFTFLCKTNPISKHQESRIEKMQNEPDLQKVMYLKVPKRTQFQPAISDQRLLTI
jgi:hypothetical protein